MSKGTLNLSGNNVLSTSGNITVTGGNLDLGGYSQTTSGTVSFQGGIVQDGTIVELGSTPCDAHAGEIDAVLDGNIGLTKTGSGTLVLGGANTYFGDTTVSEGTLELGRSNAVPVGVGHGNVVIGADATLDVGGYSAMINGLSGNGTADNSVACTNSVLTVGSNSAAERLTRFVLPLCKASINWPMVVTVGGRFDLLMALPSLPEQPRPDVIHDGP